MSGPTLTWVNASLSQGLSPQSGKGAPLQSSGAPGAPSFSYEAEIPSSLPSRFGSRPFFSIFSVNGRENQYEEDQVGKEAITHTPDPRKSLQASGIHDETSLPTCPWAALDTVGCCLSLLPHCHSGALGVASNPGTSVASTSYLTQDNGLGARPDPAGTQTQLPLYLTCVVADRTICHPCFLHLSPPHLPHVNTAGVNTLTLGPQGRHHQALQEL